MVLLEKAAVKRLSSPLVAVDDSSAIQLQKHPAKAHGPAKKNRKDNQHDYVDRNVDGGTSITLSNEHRI